ncbi:MAG: hypothetical protein ACT4OX_06580 [Actinomycetota bacterium]
MRHPIDPDDRLAEFSALWSAATPDELHRVLVLERPVRSSAEDFEPFALLQRHYETEPAATMVTALLLLTDRRWRGGVGQLVRRIAASDVLADDDLELLARAFLYAGRVIYWAIPDDWHSDERIVSVSAPTTMSDAQEEEGAGLGAVAPRFVFHPLRRWAAGWLVQREPSAWSAIWAAAKELDARAAAAVLAGLLDERAALAPNVRELIVNEARRSGDAGVRKLGYMALAERDGAEAAYALATRDKNAHIRAWVPSLLENSHETGKMPVRGGRSAQPPTLF